MYDGDGKRVKKQDSTGTTKEIWDSENVLEETDGSDATQAVYTLGLAMYGDVLSQRRGGTTQFFHFDAMGSTNQLSNISAMVTDSYLYKAFGITVISSGTTANPFRFVGREGYYLDGDLYTYWLRARIYEPVTGRFTSRDQRGFWSFNNHLFSDSGNSPIYVTTAFGYAKNNPSNLVQPSGQETEQGRQIAKKAGYQSGDIPVLLFPNPGQIPGNIANDIRNECIFNCSGSPLRKVTPGGIYCQGISSPGALLRQCHACKPMSCSRITVGGHGLGGAGVRCVSIGGVSTPCLGCNSDGTTSSLMHQILRCFRHRLSGGGYLRICSCGDCHTVAEQRVFERCLRLMARMLGMKVCACNGYGGTRANFCQCRGQWVCR